MKRAQNLSSPEYYAWALQSYTVELDLHVKADSFENRAGEYSGINRYLYYIL
jgi:hypothetical protein